MKYVITSTIWGSKLFLSSDECWTTSHKGAKLFESKEEAEAENEDEDDIEEIPDEKEFRERKAQVT